MLVRAFAREHIGIDVKIIRATAVYGSCDNFDLATANLIPAIICKVDKSADSLEIWGRGTRRMQFIYVDDVVDNLIAIARSARENFFVLGHPRAYSISQLAKIIIRQFKKKLPVTRNLAKPDNPTKLFTFHNQTRPKVGLPEGIARTITYYRTHHV